MVATNLEAGSIVLAGPKGDVALVWTGPNQERGLPPGRYRLRTTRVERLKGKEHWFLSSTGPPGKAFDVEAGKTTRIEVPATVHFKPVVRRHGAKLQLGFSIVAGDGRGLSVYRDDRRVPVRYKVLDEDGRELVAGRMNYG